ncbi:MAG TPA: hypothetical protein VKV15_19360 [Bryobacteraceae bacterium]|nr:hypothetical protein [Bryobacteraceae bacterium]
MKIAILKGTRISTNLGVLIFGGSGAIISTACGFGALQMFGPPGVLLWIGASMLLGCTLVIKSQSRHEREKWVRMELAFMGAMTGGGVIVQGMIAFGMARYLKLA